MVLRITPVSVASQPEATAGMQAALNQHYQGGSWRPRHDAAAVKVQAAKRAEAYGMQLAAAEGSLADSALKRRRSPMLDKQLMAVA